MLFADGIKLKNALIQIVLETDKRLKFKKIKLRNSKYINWIFGASLMFSAYLFSAISVKSELVASSDFVFNQADTIPQKISIHSEDNQIIDATFSPPIQYLKGNVKVYHNNTFMYCDTAVLQGGLLQMRGNVVMLQNDTIKLFADSLTYQAENSMSVLYGEISLLNGAQKLYTTKLSYHVRDKIASYDQKARLHDGSATLTSIRGVYRLNERKAIFRDKVQITDQDFKLFTDSLAYLTKDKKAEYLSPVKIYQDSSEVYAEGGWYNIGDKKGYFIGNAQITSGLTRGTADTIVVDRTNSSMSMISVDSLCYYESESDTAVAKKITYFKNEEQFFLDGNVNYRGADNNMQGERISYNKKTGSFITSGRSTISDPPMIITSDSLNYSKSEKKGVAHGKVIWKDTAANTTILSDHLYYKGHENYINAYNDTGRPSFITLLDNDTLFMKADTLRSFQKFIQTDTMHSDTIPIFTGFKNVKIFKSDLQMVCDSFVLNQRDSLFTLFDKPVVWTDTTQIAGDTICFKIKGNSLDNCRVKKSGTVITSEDLQYFDQIKGDDILCHFKSGKMNDMAVNGDAEMVYYIKDDEKAYIGVNKTQSSSIKFLFEEKKIKSIHFYIDATSKVSPMKSTNHEGIKIKGFKWIPDLRPRNKNEI